MADLTKALFRIDPTEGLLQYVQAVKPYHSKVLDVFVEYVYTEPLYVTMQERMMMTVGLEELVYPIMYSCGYGYVWNPYSEAEPADLPQATIVSAQGELSIIATPTIASSILALTADLSNYVFPVNAPVTFTTTGTFPTASVPIVQGQTYYVLSATLSTLVVSATVAGAPITFTSVGTGTFRVTQINLPYNSFLVTMPVVPQYDCIVTNLSSNQFTLATPYTVISVNPSLKQWNVTGDMHSNLSGSTILPAPGDTVYISGNTDPSANGKYTIATVNAFGVPTAGQTRFTTVEPVSLVATGTGRVYVPNDVDSVPYLAAGTAVEFSSTGAFPVPINGTTTYFFNPTPTPGVFNLGNVRYPQQFSDIVNLTAVGTGVMKIFRGEPFVPGEMVTVTGTFNGENNGDYLINTITPEGSNFRLYVLQHVRQMTPAGFVSDGSMVYTGSYGDPYCAVASSPDLFTSAFFSERIEFDFGPMPVQPYLLDTFSGIGTLSGHSTDSGHTWSVLQDLTDTLDELIRDGNGNLVTSDVNIWAASNWTIPGPNFFVEVELFVKEKPAGSPYFRVFVKEAAASPFYGPYIDIYPNVNGNIFIDARNGDLTNAGLVVDTGIPVNTKIKVKLRISTGNTLAAYVNGNLVYTSGTITWPVLTRAGFNFTVPAGDPTQFVLDRILGVTTVALPPSLAPTIRFEDTFTGSAGTVNGHVPDIGGLAWISPIVNLAGTLTGSGLVVNSVPGNGADGNSTLVGGRTQVLAASGYFIEIAVQSIPTIPSGANATLLTTQACSIFLDFGLGSEDSMGYLSFNSYGVSSGIGPPNTQTIDFVIPGVGFVNQIISTGTSLPGTHVARLEVQFDGNWRLYWNAALVNSGNTFVSNIGAAVNNNLTVNFFIGTAAFAPHDLVYTDRITYGTLA
jgi:hypothetical protein